MAQTLNSEQEKSIFTTKRPPKKGNNKAAAIRNFILLVTYSVPFNKIAKVKLVCPNVIKWFATGILFKKLHFLKLFY